MARGEARGVARGEVRGEARGEARGDGTDRQLKLQLVPLEVFEEVMLIRHMTCYMLGTMGVWRGGGRRAQPQARTRGRHAVMYVGQG